MAFVDPATEVLRQLTELGYTPPTPQHAFAQQMQAEGLTGGARSTALVPFRGGPPAVPPGSSVVPYRPPGPPAAIPRVLGGSQAALGRGAIPLGPGGATAAPGGVPLAPPGNLPNPFAQTAGGGFGGRPPTPPRIMGPIFPPAGGGPGASAGASRFAVAPKFLNQAGKLNIKALAGRAGLGLTAGTLGATAINAALGESSARHPLANIAFGAGVGATAGSVVPGVGTLAGGVVGGAVGLGTALAGGLDDLFGGSKGPKTEDDISQLNTAIAQSALSQPAKDEILTVYNTLMSLAESDEEKAEAYQLAKQMIVEKIQTSSQEQEQMEMILASQAMVQNFISPIAQNIVGSAEQQRDLLLGLAEGLPEQFRASAITQANERVASANRIAGAYANQMTSIPQITALQLEQQRQQSAAPDAAGAELQALLQGLGATG